MFWRPRGFLSAVSRVLRHRIVAAIFLHTHARQVK
jgi:hypothetical protein